MVTVRKNYSINPPLKLVVKGKVVEGAPENLEKLVGDLRDQFSNWVFRVSGKEVDAVHILRINPWEERYDEGDYEYRQYGFYTSLHFRGIGELFEFLNRLTDEVVEIKFDGFGFYGLFGDTWREPRFSTGGGVSKDKAMEMVSEFIEGMAENAREEMNTLRGAIDEADGLNKTLQGQVTNLQYGVRTAIRGLEQTKGMFKSRKIAEIRENLERVVGSR